MVGCGCEICSTNGRGGGDLKISSLEMSPKHPFPGMGLHDPLYDRQDCPELNSLCEGFGNICLREGLFP